MNANNVARRDIFWTSFFLVSSAARAPQDQGGYLLEKIPWQDDVPNTQFGAPKK